MHVPHGIVPTLAFRIIVDNRSLVFSSDQNLSKPQFAGFASNASVLVSHMVLPEGATSGTSLHAVPSEIGEFAGRIQPTTLLLSHFMARSLRDLDGNVQIVRRNYAGEIVLADDLLCLTVTGS